MLSPIAIKLFNELAKNKTIIAACDGGARANGKSNCVASYAATILYHDSIDTLQKFAIEWSSKKSDTGKFHASMDDSVEMYNYNGVIENCVFKDGLEYLSSMPLLKGGEYKRSDGTTAKLKVFDTDNITPTNNRGEFTALNILLDKITEECLEGDVVILSDSEYTIKTVDVWSRDWFKSPHENKLCEKENLDLVASTQMKLDNLRKTRKVILEHIRSHKNPPDIDTSPIEWLKWYVNDRADVLATMALPAQKKISKTPKDKL